MGLMSGRAVQRNRSGTEALHRKGKVCEAGMACQRLADQSQRAHVNSIRRSLTRRGVFEPPITPQFTHQRATGGINVAVIDMRAMLHGPGFQLIGKRAMALLEKRPTQETSVAHR